MRSESAVVDIANERVEEFHNRLKREVKKITCDLKSKEKMADHTFNLTREELETLVQVLNGQLHQVVAAMNNAK
jgi:hypothetical protein